jgi:hypothetical protein
MLSEKMVKGLKARSWIFIYSWFIGLRPYMALDDPSIRFIGPIIGRVFNPFRNTRLIFVKSLDTRLN